MNLALRKATKRGDIDASQHDAIIGNLPKPEPVAGLDPESAHYLAAWAGFGSPVAVGMMGALDLRSMQSPGREDWLRRNVTDYGDDAEPYRVVWGHLDSWLYRQAQESLKAKDDG